MAHIANLGAVASQASAKDLALWKTAQKLEANFLAEMLKSSGLGAVSDSFGGGAGEEQFGSFLRHAQADLMVQAGGIGLAQSLFEALKDQ
ncbi:MAG: rod-binding protein [Marinosulfonomonas sp.]